MKKYREGLVVGKFSPLHAGHQALIRFAQEQCDRLYVINYTFPEFDRCEPEERAHWFSVLFPEVIYLGGRAFSALAPSNDAADHLHREFCARHLLYHLNTTVDAVFSSEHYGEGFAEYLTTWFGSKLGRPHLVDHEMFDQERSLVPTSGTHLRAHAGARDHYLDPVVRASLLPRVAFVGGESSGKTTLANDLVAAYGTDVARFVPEYGRLYGDQIAGRYRYSDMEHIGIEQVALERMPADVVRLQLCDTTPMVTLWYSIKWYRNASLLLEQLSQRKYDLYVLCAPPEEYEDDGTRSGIEFRAEGYQWQHRWLEDRQHPYLEVSGTRSERIAAVDAEIKRLGLL